jgi:hypothetical protein
MTIPFGYQEKYFSFFVVKSKLQMFFEQKILIKIKTITPGSNPKISNYNASAVKTLSFSTLSI